MRILIVIILMLLTALAHGQTHTMPGSNVVPSGASLTIQSGGTITAAGGSTVTGFGGVNLTATSPVVVTPSPLTGTGIVSLNLSVDYNFATTQTITLNDSLNNDINSQIFMFHNTTGTPAIGLGAGILFGAETSTLVNQIQGVIGAGWSNVTTGAQSAYFDFQLVNSGGIQASKMRLFPSGGLSVNSITDPGAGYVNANTGFKVGGTDIATIYQPKDADLTTWAGITPVAAVGTWIATPSSANLRSAVTDENGTGALLFSGATTPDFTTGFTIGAAAAAGKIPIGNGTNYVPSTPTYPNAASTVGYLIRSDGTNFASYPNQQTNSSTANQSFTTSDTYLTNSSCVVAAGDFKAKGQYRCVFDMVKSAGTGAIVISVRIGTAGTTSDTAQLTFTFGAGTSVADSGVFDVVVNWRSVGSGTSAVVQGICRGTHNLATTGLFNNAAGWIIIGTPSGGFNSSTATTIGLSVNGSTAFAGTNSLTQAQLQQ